jgi:hypothetical protein
MEHKAQEILPEDIWNEEKNKAIMQFILEKRQNELDEFAMGFAEWFADNTLRVDLDGYKTFGDTEQTKPHTVKELLEIYKKQKGL